jgi:hypothetical protein
MIASCLVRRERMEHYETAATARRPSACSQIKIGKILQGNGNSHYREGRPGSEAASHLIPGFQLGRTIPRRIQCFGFINQNGV